MKTFLVSMAVTLTVVLSVAFLIVNDKAAPDAAPPPSPATAVSRDLGRWGPATGELAPECASLGYFKMAYDECAKLLSLPGGHQDIAACRKAVNDDVELQACIGHNLWRRTVSATPSR
jgi:hypothetical protein